MEDEPWDELEEIDELIAEGDRREAASRLGRLAARYPSSLPVRLAVADLHLRLGEYATAAGQYRLTLQQEATPEAHFGLGLCAERLADPAAAKTHFAASAALAPEDFPVPPVIPRRTFEGWLHQALAELPEELRAALPGLVIDVQDYPRPEAFRDAPEDFDALLLGYFQGVPRLYQESDYAPGIEPDRVTIYQRCHELLFGAEEAIADEARRTLYHEVAHYLGFEEEDMFRMGID